MTIAQVAAYDKADFVALLGAIYESSAWIAERAWGSKFQTVTALGAAMQQIVDMATDAEKVDLLRAHPDLAGRAALAGQVTDESREEQARAGLDSLTLAELELFTALNTKYRSKFGWPFILAVKNATKHTILGAFDRRVESDHATEFAECLRQVHKIAWMRLLDKVHPAPTGFLTCHVLDTANGTPAAHMAVSLTTPDGKRVDFKTNSDGRLDGPAVKGPDFVSGTYEWLFYVGDYFAVKGGANTAATPFLNVVPIRFGIDNPEEHYHVPLLCSPWTYSTYRGS